jgi:hypothetical protein
MDYTSWLEAPSEDDVLMGKNSLHRIWRLGASVAAPLTPAYVEGIQNATPTPLTAGSTKNVFQEGAGDEYTEVKSQWKHELAVDILAGKLFAFMAQLYGTTFGGAGYYGQATRAKSIPIITWETEMRESDGTHKYTKVYPQMILKEWEENTPMEDNPSTFTFWSKRDPFRIYAGAELVIDRFTANGSSGSFTLSSTPVILFDVTNEENEDFLLNNVVSCITKTTAQVYGSRVTSGATCVGTTFTLTPTPAAGTIVTVTYAKATA